MQTKSNSNNTIENLFKAGAHFAYSRRRRHPSARPFIYGTKNKIEIFDLEKTSELLEVAKDFVRKLASEGGQIILVGGKSEAQGAIRSGAQSIGVPYVAGRWIGGTFTNFPQIRKRVSKFEEMLSQREKGEFGKYTKKERMLLDKEIENMQKIFLGLVLMKEIPKAMFVIDTKNERIALKEAKDSGVKIVSLSGSDCNLKEIDYPIPGNDSSFANIKFIVGEIVNAYKEGKKK